MNLPIQIRTFILERGKILFFACYLQKMGNDHQIYGTHAGNKNYGSPSIIHLQVIQLKHANDITIYFKQEYC